MSCKDPNISAIGKTMDELIHHKFKDSIECITDEECDDHFVTLSYTNEMLNQGRTKMYITRADVEALAEHYDLLEAEYDRGYTRGSNGGKYDRE